MNKAKNIGLFVLLIIQAALVVFLYRPGQNNAPPASFLFSDLKIATINSLVITDENAKSVHLAKAAGHWTVGNANYPADNDKIKNILERIVKLKSARLVSRSKGSHSRLKVGEQIFNRKVVMTDTDGKEIIFFLGTAPASKAIHLRRANADEVYQISGLSSWELLAEENSWWQTKYVALNPADIQGLTINGSTTISLHRDTKGNWQLTDAPTDSNLDNKKIADLLDTVCEISISGYEDKDFTPQDKAATTITYQTKDKSFDLAIWPKDEKASEQIIKYTSAQFYAKVHPYTLRTALELKKLDLVKPKPASKPEPKPKPKP